VGLFDFQQVIGSEVKGFRPTYSLPLVGPARAEPLQGMFEPVRMVQAVGAVQTFGTNIALIQKTVRSTFDFDNPITFGAHQKRAPAVIHAGAMGPDPTDFPRHIFAPNPDEPPYSLKSFDPRISQKGCFKKK
jgi:hypothetical protein